MKAELLALVEELKRLRKQGVDRVPVSDEALAALRQRGAALARSATRRESVLESIPDAVRSATAVDFDKMMVAPARAEAGRMVGKAPATRFSRPPVLKLPEGDKRTRWKALRETALADKAAQGEDGRRVVFGIGSLDAALFFIGDAPGAEEEAKGEPFVGPAGELLNKMLKAAGTSREAVYLADAGLWRPAAKPGVQMRALPEEEGQYCRPYLLAQIEIVRPKAIVTLGPVAGKLLLGAGAFKNLAEVQGTWQDFEGTPVMPTTHPSYLVSHNTNQSKRRAWVDWLKVMEKAGLPISDKQRGFFL